MNSARHENFIPVRKVELVKALTKKIPARQRGEFNRFCRIVGSIYHFNYHQNLERLKELYVPFDPDAEKYLVQIKSDVPDNTEDKQEKILGEINALLKSGNYKEIPYSELEKAFKGASPWGIDLIVDFSQYEYYSIYYKGERRDSLEKKYLWFKKRYEFDMYDRIFFAFKLKETFTESDTLSFSKDKLYLKLFKNVPGLDLEMLFPNTNVRISLFDKGKVIVPLVAGGISSLYKIMLYVLSQGSPMVLWRQIGFWSLVGGFFIFALKSFLGYKNTIEKYLKTLTSNLYFQNLDNNSGVLTCLLDDAEEQECREILLAYYFLYSEPGVHTQKSLDERIERYFAEELLFECDFEVDDALRKLKELGLLKVKGKKLDVAPLKEACRILDRQWDGYFN
ncbi:MAG: DUF3754 domain-containing protein [Spirochaetes bacterium]|nr:DUF3754 domain-containing protein [Spirochaetota bacterium]